MLESVLTSGGINHIVERLKDEDELDAIFSYVIDYYYATIATSLKFTGHLSLEDSEVKWEERSNPAAAYIKEKVKDGHVSNDLEEVNRILLQMGCNEMEIARYISRERMVQST